MAGAQDYYGPGYDHSLGTGEGKYCCSSRDHLLFIWTFLTPFLSLIMLENKRVVLADLQFIDHVDDVTRPQATT